MERPQTTEIFWREKTSGTIKPTQLEHGTSTIYNWRMRNQNIRK